MDISGPTTALTVTSSLSLPLLTDYVIVVTVISLAILLLCIMLSFLCVCALIKRRDRHLIKRY